MYLTVKGGVESVSQVSAKKCAVRQGGSYRTAQPMQAQNLNQNTERKPESRTGAG